MVRPQTIQIFLPDGSPQGIKEAELTNRLVKHAKDLGDLLESIRAGIRVKAIAQSRSNVHWTFAVLVISRIPDITSL